MEQIIDIIPNVRKTKWLGIISKAYTMVVTDQRTIFARLDSQMLKQIVAEAAQKAKEEGKGFLGKIKAQMSASANYAERYKNMEPEEIRGEHLENFTIHHSEVNYIKVRYTFETLNGEDTQYTNESRFKIKTTNETHKFKCSGDLRQRIKADYEGKVKVK